ncbi:MAG: glycosyltransferase [Ignavibacteria bacterium]|nr:glycosyltransferase [Ignavibacteria bacterium]
MQKNIWLSYIKHPSVAGFNYETILRKSHNVLSIGPQPDLKKLREQYLDKIAVPVPPSDVVVPYNVSIADLRDKLAQRPSPDLFIWIESFDGFYPEDVQALTCPKICLLQNTHLSLAWHYEWASQFDYVFLAQREYVAEFRKRGITQTYWLPDAFDPEVMRKASLLKKYDIVYPGLIQHGSRCEELTSMLSSLFSFKNDVRFLSERAIQLSQSRIVFRNSVKNELDSTVFDTLGCGSLLFTDRSLNSGLDELFVDGEDIVIYEPDNIIDKAEYYIKHGNERERIAEAGYERVIAAHTYEHRVQDMLDVVTGLRQDTPDAAELRKRSLGSKYVPHTLPAKTYSVDEILSFEIPETPGRSFIIPVLDLSSQTEFTFETLLEDLNHLEGDVIVVFNSVEMADRFKHHPRITYSASLSHNVGVARAWNIGLMMSRTPVSFIINSDLHIERSAVDAVEKALYELDNAAIVGIEGGYIDFNTAEDIQRFFHGTFTMPIQVDNVSGFFFAVKTSLFHDGTLLFENAFTPCYYEEWDLGLQIKKAGLKSYIIPAEGVHHEFNTRARTGKLQYYNEEDTIMNISDRNQKIFWKKWVKIIQETGEQDFIRSLWFENRKKAGEALLADNKLEEAEKIFRDILSKDDIEINANYYCGFICYITGRTAEAKNYFEKVIEINPDAHAARGYLDTIS